MKKTVVKSDKVLLKLIAKSVVSCVFFLLLFDFIAAEIVFRLDLSYENAQIAAIFVSALTAFAVSFVTCYGLKNNSIAVGMLAELPLAFFSLINLIFNEASPVFFFIKLALLVLLGALGGIFAGRSGKKFRV